MTIWPTVRTEIELLLEQVQAEVTRRFESEQVPWLGMLVNQPSWSQEPSNVEAALQLLDDRLRTTRYRRTVHPDPSERYASHRVYTSPAAEGRPSLALVGHMDTVFPEASGFCAFIRDGDVVRGPGVYDMKGGLSAIVFALEAIQHACPQVFEQLAVRVVVNSDEEVGSPSSRALWQELAPLLTEALILEPGREQDRIVTARKGGFFGRIEARGRSAHAGNRHAEGVNAIHALALLIDQLERLTDHEQGITLNVGVVQGGTTANTVPAQAWCELDGRYIRASDGPVLIEELRRQVREGCSTGRLTEAQFTLELTAERPPMEPTEATQRLRARYEREAAAVGLKIGEAPLQGGGSDANHLSGQGVPCIDGLGPAGAHFHTAEERMELPSLLQRTQALARWLVATTLAS